MSPAPPHRVMLVPCVFIAIIISLSCGHPKRDDVRTLPSMTIRISRYARGELERLMMRLNSRNWHSRFVAAYELKLRGVDAGIKVIGSGLSAKEWFVRTDALRYAALCEAENLTGRIAILLKDKHRIVQGEADRALASILCEYPNPLESNRYKAWKETVKNAGNLTRVERIRIAMVRVSNGLKDDDPIRRMESLMILGGLKIPDKYSRIALGDTDSRVVLFALKQLRAFCPDSTYNGNVGKLLNNPDINTRALAAVYLAERGGGEELSWKLHEALTVSELTHIAHECLVSIFEVGPPLGKRPESATGEELSEAWRKWLISDEILKGKRDWQEPVPQPSPQKTRRLKPSRH